MEGSVDLGTAVRVQPVPIDAYAAYRSDFRENTNFCPQRDSILGPLEPQARVLPLDHCTILTDMAFSAFAAKSCYKGRKR